MKKLMTLIAVSTAVSGSLLAGQPDVQYKQVAPPPPEEFGLGWYGAIQGGVNADQDLGSSNSVRFRDTRIREEGDGDREFTGRRGNKVTLEPDGSGIGGFGGVKFGYVFGNAFVRPALEADLYYNGLDVSVNAKLNGSNVGSASGRIDSGAFMANSLLRFNFHRCQPYLGFGLGYWVAEGNDVTIKVGDTDRKSNFSTQSKDGLAWQLVGGFDYYFTEKFSGFLEYKFLNYADFILNQTAQQQLIGAGLRFHF